MSLNIGIDPNTTSLLTAIGITDDDGQLIASWFDHPLTAIRRILANPTQRSALLRLLDELLPPDPDTPGWYPLLDTEAGNLYVTVEDDVIGLAAALHSGELGSGVGQVRGTVRLPLISVAGDFEAIAGTAAGPVSIGVDVGFTGADIPMTGVGAAVTVHLDEAAPLGVQAGVRVTVDDFNLGGGDPVDLAIDSATIGADLIGALHVLLKEVIDLLVAEAGSNEQLARLADHFFDLLGIGTDGASPIPPLPLEQLFARPEAVLDWLVDIVDTPATLTVWATHLAGLIGDDLAVSGDGSADDPFRARLLDSNVVDLFLVLQATANRELEIGLDVRVAAGPVALSGVVTVLRIPLPPLPGSTTDPGAPVRRTAIVPDATVALVAPTSGDLIGNGPTLQIGQVGAGFRLTGREIQPWLSITNVVIDDADHGTVDLTDADAVIGVVADAALSVIEDAFGDSAVAVALLTLLGLREPDSDPTSPHLLDPAALGRGPTIALGSLHRAILQDSAHPWSHMLGQVALLVGLTPDVTGSGTTGSPWITPIAAAGPVELSLAAWNARVDTDPAGFERLRLGIMAGAGQGVFEGQLLVELLAIDLPPTGSGSVSLIGRSRLAIQITPDGPLDLSGLAITSGPAQALVSWLPGERPACQVGVTDVTVRLDGQVFGPYDFTMPGLQPDLGLGADALRLLGQLISSALRSWAGRPAYVLAALLGLHHDLTELPDDWPLLSDVLGGSDQLQRVLDDPAGVLRAYVGRVLTGISADGAPYVGAFLQTLGGLLPSDTPPGLELPVLRSISGSGRYDDPWVIPIVDQSADTSRGATTVDGLVWLDPAGPPAEWIATIAQLANQVGDGVFLTNFLSDAAAFRPQLATQLGSRNLDALARGFDDLAAWLTASDGMVPLASQLPAGWKHGTTVGTTHALLPKDPAVIDQVVAQLATGTGPVLLVAPPFADHTIFTDLITAVTGASPVAGRHFDLRALPNPAEVDLTQIVDSAAVYTADLLASDAAGEIDQLQRVVERIRTITGQPVRVLGHSTAGVVARTLAAAHPEMIDGLITLGSPHAGSDLRPLVDGALADAVRVAGSVAGPIADTALGGTVGWLDGLLDGTGSPLLGGAVEPGWFAGVADGLVDSVPGFAIGSQLAGDLIGLLAGSTITELAAAEPPTHVAFGLRLGLATPRGDQPPPAEGPGEVALTADARVDLARLRLSPDAPEPPRPATAVSLSTRTYRRDGWLVGAGVLPDGPLAPRVRLLEAGVTITPAGASARPTAPGSPPDGAVGAEVVAGGLGIAPWLRLVDASVDATPVQHAIEVGDQRMRAALEAVLAELDAAVADPAAQAALDLLEAAGVVFTTTDGPRASIQGLTDLATVPIRTLTERRTQLLATLRGIIGDPDLSGVDLGGLDPASLSVTLPELPLRLSLDDTTMVVRLETTADITLAGPFAVGGRLDLDTRSLAGALDVSLLAGPLVLRRNLAGTIDVSATPWLASPLVLRPLDPTALRFRLLDLITDLSVSAIASAVLGSRVGGGVSIPPISALIRDPAGWLRSPQALGNAAGMLDGGKINDLLTTIAGALQLDDRQGLGLPGGFLLSASGSDPLHVQLSGTFDQGAPVLSATVALGLDLRTTGPLPGDAQVTASGSIVLDLSLSGDWGDLTIEFSVDASGVRLVVTPENVAPVRLLPNVSGIGELLGGAVTALVPRVLQEITDEILGHPSHPVLDVALQIADALGIYDAAADGWTGSAQTERLRNMLDPGWLRTQVSDPSLIIGHIQGLFPDGANPGPIPLPPGHRITRVENRLRWEMDLLPGCQLGAELGWAAAGHPQVRITLDNLDTGPVTIVAARLGYLDDFEGLVRARVEVGEPLEWFTPEIELSAAGSRLGVRILPLGAPAVSDAEIVLAPTPGLTLTPEGGLQLAGSWLLPLLTHYVLPQVEDLLSRPLWPTGPSARRILHGAGLVTSDTGALRIVTRFPEPAVIGMGALEVALAGVSIDITDDLALTFAEDAGRFGIRLQGSVTFPGDVSVTLLFGQHSWIGDGAGVTAWVVGPSSDAALPVAPAPGINAVGVGLQIAGTNGDPLFGGDDSVVELGGVGAMFFGNFAFWDSATNRATFAVDSLGAAVELTDAAIRVNGSDGDSFVAKLIPQELGAGFTTAIAYRDGQLEVHGGPGDLTNGIELTFPLNLNILDLILLRELYLGAVFGQRTNIVAALSGNAEIGPIAVTVTRVGLRVTITGSGASLSFKPPDGFGFSLDASTIRLGGFLLVNEAHGRYVGALEISVLEKFALTAIGIITTKNPDGSPGFSLLVLITVTLPVPIPLGYGFFFAGAGGLLGLNRGMDVDRIRDGLRTGTADSILFPTDIINRIDVIVRDLEEAFPAREGHFLIAPMGMITWMNPALVTLKVGIVLEIAPQPNIALLGVLRLALPTPDEAVVDLKVAFIGGIDVGASLLYFDAAIYDSFIGYGDFKLSLEGDIAIRLCWGATPDLVVSIGGFHPGYTPAANLKLPAMRRLTLSLLKDNPRLTLKLYFALTSNTVQFGAQLEFYVGVSGFSISGDFGFDVLVQFVPFLIDAHMWGRLAVTAGGCDVCSISLDLSLRGPTPWHAHGTASFKILFFKISVAVEATFGDAHETSIPAEPVLPKVLEQFRDPLSWVAELSAAASAGVTLLPLPQGELVVNAGGMLSARQNLIPLETDIGLVGKTPPSDVQRVTITGLSFGVGTIEQVGFDDLTAPFSPSTFAGAPSTSPDLLTAPAFEQRPNGVRATSGEALEADFSLYHPQSYEMIIIDDPDPEAPPQRSTTNPRLAFSLLVPGGAIGNSAAARAQRMIADRGKVRSVTTAEPRYAVTSTDSLVPLGADGQPAAGGTELLTRTEAEQRLAAMPSDGRRFQLVPEVQVVR